MPLSLKLVHDTDPIVPKKPPVAASTLAHKDLRRGTWWQKIPAYKTVDEATFLDHAWQARSSITKVAKLVETIQELVPPGFIEDLENGMKRAPMSVRVSPYIVSLIDWEHPYEDPLRTQFFPLASRLLPDHPKLGLDSLAEQADAPVPGLTHRYPDKALFLPLDTCPVYCRFCTRSLRDRPRHRRGREGPPPPQRGALAPRVPVHRVAPGARGHRHQRRRRLPAPRAAHRGDRRRAARDPERAAHALRDQGSGGHADEDPHRRRLARRADARRRQGAQAPQGRRPPHALQQPQRDHRHHRGGDGSPLRARDRRAQPERADSRRQRHASRR